MSARFTLVVNPGRSGSTQLAALLRQGAPGVHVNHEALDKYAAQPNLYQRAWTPRAADAILEQPAVAQQIAHWRAALASGPVVETGWTAAHLGPVLYRVFGDAFAIVLLHRHPIIQAASRTIQGMYADAWRDRDHELDPFHKRALYPNFRERWRRMHAFERCLYAWLEITTQGLELHERLPHVPYVELPAADLFARNGAFNEAVQLIGANPEALRSLRATRNPATQTGREAWPLGTAWQRYRRHPEVITLGEALGYRFDESVLATQLQRYQRPPGLGPQLRSRLRYHQLKRALSRRFPNGPTKRTLQQVLRGFRQRS